MKKVSPFTNRWLITGTLTTLSELHIGDGGEGEIHNRAARADKEKKQSDASTVAVDVHGRAFIPASAIKGVLRARLKACANGGGSANIPPPPTQPWDELLGSESVDAPGAVGAKLVFFDAFHQSGHAQPTLPAPGLGSEADIRRPWWDDTRKTCVAVAVSLDRRTRTAKEQLLYHLEYVPAGEVFTLEIGGDNLTKDEVRALLSLLESFNNPHLPVTLGGQASNSWGRVGWKCTQALCFDNLPAWLKEEDPPTGYDICDPKKFGRDILPDLIPAKTEVNTPPGTLTIELELLMESPWLICDPRQSERSSESKGREEADKPVDARPIQDEKGRPFIPAKSLRGALRSRAEMILRTLNLPCADHPSVLPSVTTKGGDASSAIREITQLDLAARLFGLSGWLAPLHIPRFYPPPGSSPVPHHQEFVAIDRFTGGPPSRQNSMPTSPA